MSRLKEALALRLSVLQKENRRLKRCKYNTNAARCSLALGTVQLGLAYGAANTTGLPSEEEAIAIILLALAGGVVALDTARAYGLSEARIGKALRNLPANLSQPNVITKLKLGDFGADYMKKAADSKESPPKAAGMMTAEEWENSQQAGKSEAGRKSRMIKEMVLQVDESINTSLNLLQGADPASLSPHQQVLPPTVLLHYWPARSWGDGAVWDRLRHWRAMGLLGGIGTSTYTPEDVMQALEDPDVEHIQLPTNLLDWRWRTPAFLYAVGRRPDVTVHARSVFLQGILVSDASRWPVHARDELAPLVIACLERFVTKFGRRDRADLCMAYVRGLPWVTFTLAGVETRAQLRANLSVCDPIACPPLCAAQRDELERTLPVVPVDVLNPALWPDTKGYGGSFRKGGD